MTTQTRPLTFRQREIMTYAAKGFTLREISEQLGVCHQTVKNHVRNVYLNLGVGTQAQAFTALGWLRPYDICGCVQTCTRPTGHRGHHGGFRDIGTIDALAQRDAA